MKRSAGRDVAVVAGEGLSIGDLAEACGISEPTLRAWERRYGRPKAARRPSGHRRYDARDVTFLRRVAEALTRGAKPSQVLAMSEADLDALLAQGSRDAETGELILRQVEWVRDYEGARLRRSLREAWNRMEPLPFLAERVAPLLVEVGRQWADGKLDVRHEHFLSEVLEDLLRTLRDRMAEQSTGPLILATTLPGEEHRICSQMVAVALAALGARPRVLGPQMPIPEIARAAAETRAQGVALSISLATGGVTTDRRVAELRAALPDGVRLAIGGEGVRNARRAAPGVDRLLSLNDLAPWIEGLDRPSA